MGRIRMGICAFFALAVFILQITSGVQRRKTSASASNGGEHLMKQWECTRASRACGCKPPSSTQPGHSQLARYDLVRSSAAPCRRRVHRQVQVLLDKKTWLWQEFPTGEYACLRSTCSILGGDNYTDIAPDQSRQGTPLPSSVDIFLTSVPGGSGPPLSRPGQRTVALALESQVRYPFTADETWLRAQNISDVVVPGIWKEPVPGWLGAVRTWPMTYSNADWAHYQRSPLPLSQKIRGIAAFITNCDTKTGTNRLRLLEALEAGGVPVYSFGKCRNTHAIQDLFPECVANQTDTLDGHRSPYFDFVKMCVIRRFMFTAAFENDVADDYVSEKMYHAFLAGSVPVYAGAPNVAAYLPAPEAAIAVSDFSNEGIQRLVEHVRKVMHDPAKYNRALTWKKSQPSQSMRVIIEHSYATLPCTLCDYIAWSRDA